MTARSRTGRSTIGARWRSEPSPRPYTDPYLAGIGIGPVLARRLRPRRAGTRRVRRVCQCRRLWHRGCPGNRTRRRIAGSRALSSDGIASPLQDWLVLELAGCDGRRLRLRAARGPATPRNRAWRTSQRQRSVCARPWAGASLMGVGAKLARGCTSGQALSGGALLSVGSWIFITDLLCRWLRFAPLARRLWR